jgi:2-keto-4-pentenoate hydratase/2-oxohepta-3-ene-1,7-dioic acid hydratase in catechol pathway
MRIARVADGRAAVVDGTELNPLRDGVTVLDALLADAADREGLIDARAAALDLATTPLLAPIAPASIRDFVAFEEHVEGVRRAVDGVAGVPEAWYEAPQFYFTNPHSVHGPGEPVAVPPGCRALDFELEVAAIIGREGRDLTPEQARSHIVGYTILNDWSARDLQSREMRVGLGPAKGKDFAISLGPWIVSVDELEPYRVEDRLDLDERAFINGVEVGSDTLANMGWSFEEMVAYSSRGTVVRPGDVLGSGTCGSGCLAELWGRNGRQEPPPLQPGDEVVLRVQGIGELATRIVAGGDAVPVPRARPPRRRPRPWD